MVTASDATDAYYTSAVVLTLWFPT